MRRRRWSSSNSRRSTAVDQDAARRPGPRSAAADWRAWSCPAPDGPTIATVAPAGMSSVDTVERRRAARRDRRSRHRSNRIAEPPTGRAAAPGRRAPPAPRDARHSSRRVEAIVSASWRLTWAISEIGRNEASASRISSGSVVAASCPLARPARPPTTATASPPSPVAISSCAVCDRQIAQQLEPRSADSRAPRAMKPSRRRPTAWNATRSDRPWIVSVT